MMHEHDLESGHGNSMAQKKLHSWTFLPFLQFFGGGIYAPDPSTYDPIEILLNAEDPEEQNTLTARWRDNKLSELNFVGVVVCPTGTETVFRLTCKSLHYSLESSRPLVAGHLSSPRENCHHGQFAQHGIVVSFFPSLVF
jgi:hypothetical protein